MSDQAVAQNHISELTSALAEESDAAKRTDLLIERSTGFVDRDEIGAQSAVAGRGIGPVLHFVSESRTD